MTKNPDEAYVDGKEIVMSITEDTQDAAETDPSAYGYSPDVNGSYEPIYADFTRPPVLNTSTYENILSYSLLDKFKEVEKINAGYIYNQNDPYPVDAKIKQLEQHDPKVVFSDSEIFSVRSMSTYHIEADNKINEVLSLLDTLSKRVEKRLVQLDNINATTMRYLYRIASRININCVYYGGQSIYNKYNCIRCLDDDLINDTPVTLDQCLNCTRYEPVVGQVYDIDDTDSSVLHSAIMTDDMQMSRVKNEDVVDTIKVDVYHTTPSVKTIKLEEPDTKQNSGFIVNWSETSLNDQNPHVVDYNSGSQYTPDDSSSSTIIDSKITANEMLDIFEQSSYLSNYKTKKDTMLEIGRVLAKSDYHPTFIIGVMGHIQGEGNVGQFEKVHTGTWYFKTMQQIAHSSGGSYYEYYQRYFSNQYIYNNKSLSEVQKLIEELLAIKYKDSNGSQRSLGFGLGCLQWTFERTQNLVNIYKDTVGKRDIITQEEAYRAEAQMISNELRGAYKKVYTYWYGNNSNKFTAKAAYSAGNNALIGYGLNPVYLTSKLPSSFAVWNDVADTRGKNAEQLFYAIANNIK